MSGAQEARPGETNLRSGGFERFAVQVAVPARIAAAVATARGSKTSVDAIAFEMNSGPLSTRMVLGAPRTEEIRVTLRRGRLRPSNGREMLGKQLAGSNVSHYAPAMQAAHLKGLPPTYVSAGSFELFPKEDVAYAMRLLAAGGPVESHVYSGAYHGLDLAADENVSYAAEAERPSALSAA